MIEVKHSRWRLVLTLASFALLVILVYALRHQIGQVIADLKKVHSLALLLLIPIQILNYDFYARFYRRLFAILGESVNYWPLYKTCLELNFVNHILPSGGVSGVSYFAVRMRQYKISGAKATISQVLKLFLLYTSFQPLLVLGVFLLALRGHTNNLIILVASSLVTLMIVGTLLAIYVIEDRQRINNFLTFLTKSINWLIHLIRPKHPETFGIIRAQAVFNELHDNYVLLKNRWRELKTPFLYMLLANITELASLYVVYVAFGRWVNLGAIILAYAVANFAGLISVLPAGIGIYEGLMTAVLAATGIPASLSIPVTIMYRVLSMLVQVAPGYFFYQKALSAKRANK